MNCQEVMEYMHRQLDDDLDAREQEVLLSHTSHCPDCSAMFERLKHLSAELASLPKVVPSYSLVDAIMPELDRIEFIRQQEAELNVVAAEKGEQLAGRRAGRKRRWPAISAIGSAIAAGIVASIFIITYPPDAARDKADQSNSLVANELNRMNKDSSALQDQIVPMTATNEERGMVGTQSYSEENAESQEKVQGIRNDVHTEVPGAFSPDLTGAGSSNSNTGAGDDTGRSQFLGNDQHGEALQSEPGMTINEAGQPEQETEDQYGGAPNVMDPQNQTVSPNGQYIARVKQYTIVIARAGDDEKLIETARKNGKHMNLVWSDDSKQLTYEVHLDQGAIEKYVVESASGREEKAPH